MEEHPYYSHIDYDNIKKDPSDGLPDEKIISTTQLPVYSSINQELISSNSQSLKQYQRW
jgi:hypothetical protein